MNTEKIRIGGPTAEKKHVVRTMEAVFHDDSSYNGELKKIYKLSSGQLWYLGSIFSEHARDSFVAERAEHHKRLANYQEMVVNPETRKILTQSSWQRLERGINFLKRIKLANDLANDAKKPAKGKAKSGEPSQSLLPVCR